jgi:hypothetical protein
MDIRKKNHPKSHENNPIKSRAAAIDAQRIAPGLRRSWTGARSSVEYPASDYVFSAACFPKWHGPYAAPPFVSVGGGGIGNSNGGNDEITRSEATSRALSQTIPPPSVPV